MSVMNGWVLALVLAVLAFAGCYAAGDAYAGGARVAYALGRMADPVALLGLAVAWLGVRLAFRLAR